MRKNRNSPFTIHHSPFKSICCLLVLCSLGVLFFTASLSSAAETENGTPEMLFFFSKDCDECKNIKREFLPEFLKKYQQHFTFIELDVEEPANRDSLFAMEDRIGVPEADKNYPAVYFMGNMIEGEIPVALKLEALVNTYLANPDSMQAVDREVRARIPQKITPAQIETAKNVHMAYFYEQGCKKCGRAEEIIIWLTKNYDNIAVKKYDIDDTADRNKNKILATTLGLRSGVPENKLMSTPAFFIGDEYLLSENISRKKLAELVDKYSKTGSNAVWEHFNDQELKNAESFLEKKMQSFGFFVIAFAGLGDGINPCAFATILFFVSYLGIVGRKGREILMVGLAFAFSVFITYFLVGLGFLNIVKSITNIEILAKIIFGGTAALCVIFGFLSIADYFKVRAGKTHDMALQLPVFLKKRIHATIRENVRTNSIVAGALVAGFMVSILELACTGQLYLPTIVFMLGRSGSQLSAVFYLLVYNVFFIVPLLIVFGFVYKGVSSRSVAKIMEARVGMVKLGLAFVFFTVAALLLWSLYS